MGKEVQSREEKKEEMVKEHGRREVKGKEIIHVDKIRVNTR